MTATLLKEASLACGSGPVDTRLGPLTGPAPAPDHRRCCSRPVPALLLLGALVVYPVLFSIGRSFFDASGTRFVGGGNYTEMFTRPGDPQGRPQQRHLGRRGPGAA